MSIVYYIIRFTLLAVIFAIVVILLIFINNKLTQQMDLLKESIIAYLEQEWGQQIQYERISPSLLNAFEISNLILYDENNKEDFFRFKKFTIRYNIFRLFLHPDVIHAVSEINFSGTTLFFDFDQPLDPQFMETLISLLDRLSNSPYPFRVSTSQITINGISQGNQIQMQDIAFDIVMEGDEFRINLKRGGIRIDFPEYNNFWVYSRFRANGFIPKDLSWVDIRLTLADFSSSLLSLKEQTLQFTLRDSQLKIRKIADKSPLNLDFTYDFIKQNIHLIFETENYRPLDILSFSGAIAGLDINEFLSSSITSKGDLSYSLETGDLDYLLDALFVIKHPLLPPELKVSFSASGDEKYVAFNSLVVNSNIGTIDFVGNILYANLFPEGLLNVVDFKGLSSDKNLDATFLINRRSGSVSLRGQKLYLGTSGFDQFDLDLYPRDEGLLYDLKASLAYPGIDDSISAQGIFKYGDGTYLSVNSRFSEVPLALLYKLFVPKKQYSQGIWDFAENYFFNSEINLETDFVGFKLESPLFNFTDYQNPNNYLDLRFVGDQDKIDIEPVALQYHEYKYQGQSELHFDSFDRITFFTDFTINDMPYSFEGAFASDSGLKVKGDYDFLLDLDFNQANRYAFRVSAKDFPLLAPQYNAAEILLNFESSGFYENPDSWEVLVPKLTLENAIFFQSRRNFSELSFILNQREFIISEINYKDEFSNLTGSGEFFWDMNNFKIDEISMLMRNEETQESYRLVGNYLDNQLTMDFEFSSAPLRRYISPVLSGVALGNATIFGPISNLQWEVGISFQKAKINADPLEFSVSANIKEGEIAFSDLNIVFLDHYIQQGLGRFSLNRKDFSFSSQYRTHLLGRSMHSDLSIEGFFLSFGQNKELDLLEDDFTSTLTLNNLVYNNEPGESWKFFLSRAEQEYLVSGGPDNILKGKISPKGDLMLTLSSPFPVQTRITGQIFNQSVSAGQESVWIQANMHYVNIDLASLSALVFDKEILEFQSGRIYGEDISISGLLSDPDFSGQLTISDTGFKSFFSPKQFSGIQTNMVFDEKQIRFDQNQIQIDGGNISWAGQFELDHWIPSSYLFNFDVSGSSGLDTFLDLGTIVIDGYAVGNLVISGNENQIRIGGEVTANYCAFTLSNQQEEAVSEDEQGADLFVDIDFISGRKVEFLWPSSTIPVLNCFAEQNSQIHIVYESNRDFLDLQGNMNLQGGQIFFFNRNFFIESGNINFDMLATGRFDPRISLKARIREIDEQGEDVNIYLIAENQFLNDFNPRFESTPSKSEAEIYLIMGRAIQEQFQQGGISLVLFSSELLSEFGFFKPLEDAIRQTFNLDIFSIRTQVVENILKEKVLGTGESENEEVTPVTLGDYLDNTTIFIGQYIGKDLLIMGLVRLKETDYDASSTGLGAGLFGVEPELEFTLEWPTPFFNLEWSFKPTEENLKDLYITDNRISLEWSFSY